MNPDKKNTFCYYPFQQIALKSWVKDQGIYNISPCCNSVRPEHMDPLNTRHYFEQDGYKPTAKELFHGKEMSELRESMLKGERHPACQVCWKMEDSNPENPASYRLLSTPVDESDIENPELRSIDFMFGEECNLRCRMCGPGLSNKLRHDYRFFHKNNINVDGISGFEYRKPGENEHWYIDEDSHKTVKHFDEGPQWQDILDNITDLREIKATGGETTLTKPFKQFLERAIEADAAKNIELNFHTNCTKFTNQLVEQLANFKRLKLECSIDSYGKNYEYIRYPMKWEKLSTSLHNLLSKTVGHSHLLSNINFTVVLSSLNAFHIRELFEYQISLWEQYKHVKHYNFYIDLLIPENKFTNVKFLTPDLKEELIEIYEGIESVRVIKSFNEEGLDINCSLTPKLRSSINFLKKYRDLKPTEQDRLNMLREVTVFDMSRNQDYHDYLDPRIIKYLETPLD